MDRTERFYKIDHLLNERRVVPFSVFLENLEISPATLKRDLDYLRTRLNAPIIWDREEGGYRFSTQERVGQKYELPGLWFNASEIHALLTMMHLLSNLQGGGILAPHVAPLMVRLRSILGVADVADEISKRVRILNMGSRPVTMTHFEQVGSGLLQRKRLQISYFVRSRGDLTDREVSPQRLVHYRDNWYLDAWCHLRGELRSFALDAIKNVDILDKRARDVSENSLNDILGSGYGIFSGRKVTWAKLRFTPERARWVAAETWHPKQNAKFEKDGSYLLEVPYSDDRELIGDILRHGPEVEVLEPPALRERCVQLMDVALKRYRRGNAKADK